MSKAKEGVIVEGSFSPDLTAEGAVALVEQKEIDRQSPKSGRSSEIRKLYLTAFRDAPIWCEAKGFPGSVAKKSRPILETLAGKVQKTKLVLSKQITYLEGEDSGCYRVMVIGGEEVFVHFPNFTMAEAASGR